MRVKDGMSASDKRYSNLHLKLLCAVALGLLVSACPSQAEDKTAPVLNPTERARLKRQIDSLAASKVQAAKSSNTNVKNQAIRDGKAIDQTVKQQKERVDKAADSLSWYYGRDLATAAGAAKKRQLEEAALAQKQKIAAEAKRRADLQNAAAQKSIQNIEESVTGLKSQVAKKGQYGLQPKGSNLNVRNYGTK